MAVDARRQPVGRIPHVDVGRSSTHHSGTCANAAASLILVSHPHQHRGDMAGPEASVVELLMQISSQFASEYLVFQGLQEEVKKAFASGNFK